MKPKSQKKKKIHFYTCTITKGEINENINSDWVYQEASNKYRGVIEQRKKNVSDKAQVQQNYKRDPTETEDQRGISGNRQKESPRGGTSMCLQPANWSTSAQEDFQDLSLAASKTGSDLPQLSG